MDDIESLFGNTGQSQSDVSAPPSMDTINRLFQNNDHKSPLSAGQKQINASLLYSEEYGIRDSVRSQVEDVRWLKAVTKHLKEDEQSKAALQGDPEALIRCAVCTLPIGSSSK
jgi:hypothetical protein